MNALIAVQACVTAVAIVMLIPDMIKQRRAHKMCESKRETCPACRARRAEVLSPDSRRLGS